MPKNSLLTHWDVWTNRPHHRQRLFRSQCSQQTVYPKQKPAGQNRVQPQDTQSSTTESFQAAARGSSKMFHVSIRNCTWETEDYRTEKIFTYPRNCLVASSGEIRRQFQVSYTKHWSQDWNYPKSSQKWTHTAKGYRQRTLHLKNEDGLGKSSKNVKSINAGVP